jgi:hypothetical protein
MAEINFAMGLVVGTQNANGDLNSVVSSATTIADLAAGGGDPKAGGVLGDSDSGIGETGIEIEFTREQRDRSPVSGSLTAQQGEFLREAISGFEIGWVLKGSGAGTVAADADHTLQNGRDALLEGMGLLGGAWGSGIGWRYAPGSAKALTVALWIGPNKWVFQDCTASGSIEFTPAGLAIVKSRVAVGSVASFSSPGFPGTVNYGTQASLSAPVVQGVAHTWGALRGFTGLTLDFDNEIEELEDSNAATGKRSRPTGRTITAEATIWADDADSDFERANLVSTSAPTTLLNFTVGTAATPPANAFEVRLTNPQALTLKPTRLQDKLGYELTLQAVDDAANGEFELIFK